MQVNEASLLMLLLLGAAHGINPSMGWLFAVSLGLQEQRRGAVWSALGPLALGHALAIAVVVVAAAGLGFVVPIAILKWIVAATLLVFGVLHLTRHRHPRFGGMRVGARELTIWSFLMASAHGAGLMALPLVLGMADAGAHPHTHVHGASGAGGGHAEHLAAAAFAGPEALGLIATLVHTVGYLAVAGIIAVLVYEKLGLRLLRTAWINLNVVWAAALMVTAVLTPLL